MIRTKTRFRRSCVRQNAEKPALWRVQLPVVKQSPESLDEHKMQSLLSFCKVLNQSQLI